MPSSLGKYSSGSQEVDKISLKWQRGVSYAESPVSFYYSSSFVPIAKYRSPTNCMIHQGFQSQQETIVLERLSSGECCS